MDFKEKSWVQKFYWGGRGNGGGRNGEKGMLTSSSAEASPDPGDSNMLPR